MEIITRSFTTAHGEPASTWHVRHQDGEDLITAGQITRTDNGYVVDRNMGRRYTYRTAARAAQAMREHIADKWPDELSATAAKELPAYDAAILAAADSALDQLRQSPEMAEMVALLTDIQRRTESTGTWSTPLGRAIEYALGHLRLAMQAPDMKEEPAPTTGPMLKLTPDILKRAAAAQPMPENHYESE
jgi:hypothetical protein